MKTRLEIGISSPHSPHALDIQGVFISGKEYASVAAYMEEASDGSFDALSAALLAKYTQYIYLQKSLCDAQVVSVYASSTRQHEHAWEQHLQASYEYVRAQLQSYSDEELMKLMHVTYTDYDSELMKERLRFFRSSQTFIGRDKALFLSLVWINRLIYQCTYDKRVEKTLRSLVCDA